MVSSSCVCFDPYPQGPVNIGNPGEFTMKELADKVKEVVNPDATTVFKENTADDPGRRRPDISKAKELLGWEPKVPLAEGLKLMVGDFKKRLGKDDEPAAKKAKK